MTFFSHITSGGRERGKGRDITLEILRLDCENSLHIHNEFFYVFGHFES